MRTRALLGISLALVIATACSRQAEPGLERDDVRSLVLVPSDFERGYTYGDDTACGGLYPEGESEAFTNFVRETDPAGCAVEIVYIWGGARTRVVPRVVESGAVVFDDEDDARRGMELRKQLASFVSGESPRDLEEVPGLADAATRFRNGGFDVPPGAGVIWRHRNVIAVVFAGGTGIDPAKAPELALDLARKQQRRIENPTPPRDETVRDEELPLDDPQLDAPVYWLGREFNPGEGLPSLRFSGAHTYGGSGGEPAFTAELDYGAQEGRRTVGAKLMVFRPDSFEKFERTIIGRFVRDTPCFSATRVRLPSGRVTVWGGFAKPTRPPCPARPYDRYFAHVFLRGAVVAINHPLCYYPCRANLQGTADPYNTPRGLIALARGLHVRR